MKRKGFTLIELLAVIVVLAIIALIATPIVMNVIKNADKGAAERSAERYLDAVEHAIATDKLNEGVVLDGTYTVDGEGNLSLDGKKLTVEVNGDLPKSGSKVGIKNGQVVVDGTNLDYGDYTVTIDSKGSATATEKGSVAAEVLCTAIAPTYAGEQATSSEPYKIAAVYSCDLGDGARTFYVLKEDGDNIKLLGDFHLGSDVTWCISGDNTACDADRAKAVLADGTSGWTKLFNAGGTVELPDAYEILDATGHPDWSYEYLNDDWLIDGEVGFWTSTRKNDSYVYVVWGDGGFVEAPPDEAYYVRPVIVISKANMSL